MLFYLDMNNFKQVNDQYGHDTGDALLREVAVRIKSCIRENDIATRIGGDEFTVILVQKGSEEIGRRMKTRLKEHISTAFTLAEDAPPFYPEISVGFARFPEDSAEVETIIRLADQRMYEEKRASKEKNKGKRIGNAAKSVVCDPSSAQRNTSNSCTLHF